MILVMDLQGFKTENNKFIVKELAGYDGEKMCHFVFKPPFPFDMLPSDLQKQAKYLTKNHHGIEWNVGFTPLHYLKQIIGDFTAHANYVYVKGREKANFLKQYTTTPVLEFEEQPALQKTNPKCLSHSQKFCMCALSNVFKLYESFIMH